MDRAAIGLAIASKHGHQEPCGALKKQQHVVKIGTQIGAKSKAKPMERMLMAPLMALIGVNSKVLRLMTIGHRLRVIRLLIGGMMIPMISRRVGLGMTIRLGIAN